MSDSKLRLRDEIVLTSKEDTMFFLNIDQAVAVWYVSETLLSNFFKEMWSKEKVEIFHAYILSWESSSNYWVSLDNGNVLILFCWNT